MKFNENINILDKLTEYNDDVTKDSMDEEHGKKKHIRQLSRQEAIDGGFISIDQYN